MCRLLGIYNTTAQLLEASNWRAWKKFIIFYPIHTISTKLDLKQLPLHLRFAYLGTNSTLPVIISSFLTGKKEEKLLRILRDNKATLGMMIADIKGISPSLCMHKILMDDRYKPTVQPQCCLTPVMKEVVEKRSFETSRCRYDLCYFW